MDLKTKKAQVDRLRNMPDEYLWCVISSLSVITGYAESKGFGNYDCSHVWVARQMLKRIQGETEDMKVYNEFTFTSNP
jgi:hypothetical protein